MVNMYSMGMMNGVSGINGMNASLGNTGNVHQDLKNKYGVGYEDFGSKPYTQPYPFATVPHPSQYYKEDSSFRKFLKLLFCP